MFRYKLSSQFITVLNSYHGSKPLQNWKKQVSRNGRIRRLNDKDTQNLVLEIIAPNVDNAYISCPKDPANQLGINLPVLVLLIKNMKKYFRLKVQILDDTGATRTFIGNNYQSTATVCSSTCTLPVRMDHGWNHMAVNLAQLTEDAFGTNYVETLNLVVHGNCRIARIYFSNKSYGEGELPEEYKIIPPKSKFRKTL